MEAGRHCSAVKGFCQVYKWYLPTLSEIVALSEPIQVSRVGFPAQQRVKAEREWSGAIAALNTLLQQRPEVEPISVDGAPIMKGMLLSGPSPVLDQPELVDHFSTWTFTADPLSTTWMPLQLLPANKEQVISTQLAMSTLPLLPNDPLAAEQFCLILTPDFALVMVLGEGSEGEPAFLFSFVPEVIQQAWRSLRSRLVFTSPQFLHELDTLVEQFAPVSPDYQTVMQFSQLMLAHMPDPSDWDDDRQDVAIKRSRHAVGLAAEAVPLSVDGSAGEEAINETVDEAIAEELPWQTTLAERKAKQRMIKRNTKDVGSSEHHPLEKLTQGKTSSDTELLQAIAHEVRTPLTTIRTLTRLLLKRKDLNPDVLKRLSIIDKECTEQIDRFSLIFRAVELETAPVKRPLAPLAAISLAEVFQQNVPRWQEQASQRNLSLEVKLPQKMPMVVADSTMLEQMLTGLIDRITHSLPPDSHIQIHVQLAGHQLKLQFQSQPPVSNLEADGSSKKADSSSTPTLKSIGQLLMFQPETGNLSLNLSVTKNLFQALGGKLIVRQRPQQGEVLTIFLPLETRYEP
jgi:signal transduction histidine kinase